MTKRNGKTNEQINEHSSEGFSIDVLHIILIVDEYTTWMVGRSGFVKTDVAVFIFSWENNLEVLINFPRTPHTDSKQSEISSSWIVLRSLVFTFNFPMDQDNMNKHQKFIKIIIK